ncbi:c-type cytochrome biogenesis protein CcmI [Parvibaculaceae bacterium PLY_AMNH_Bact1]|nr:c-type cytochrome biogenesis protein CcmI [Parvibaculaceae bacterium PLY_AMNH_Bact1]
MPLSSQEMLLWLLFAAVTAATIAYILRTVLGEGKLHGDREAGIAVYQDQLEELDRDVEKGVLPEAEATSARIEISRRLLAAADSGRDEPPSVDPGRGRVLLVAIAGVLPLCVLATYLAMGSPGLPGQPYTERLEQPLDQLPVEGLVARLEEQLKQEPDDATGWRLIAPVYMQLGRYSDAINAFGTIMQLEGRDADALAGLGEALTLSGDGMVPPPARQAFEAALREDPAHARARFYLALAKAQRGDIADALSDWQALLAEAPEGAPWAEAVEAQVRAAENILATQNAPNADE